MLKISDSRRPDGYEPGSRLELIVDEHHTIACGAFPRSRPATNLTWDIGPVVAESSKLNTSSTSSSSSSSRVFSSERRLTLMPRAADHGAVIRCHGYHPGLTERISTSVQLYVRGILYKSLVTETKHNCKEGCGQSVALSKLWYSFPPLKDLFRARYDFAFLQLLKLEIS